MLKDSNKNKFQLLFKLFKILKYNNLTLKNLHSNQMYNSSQKNKKLSRVRLKQKIKFKINSKKYNLKLDKYFKLALKFQHNK